MSTMTFDELLASCPGVTLSQLEYWKIECEKDGHPTPNIDRAITAFKCAELEDGCSVTAGSLDTDAFYKEVESRKQP